MQAVDQKPKICSKEWFEAELKKANREVRELRKKSFDLESENKTLENDLFKQRREIFHLKHANEEQKKQIDELFLLAEQFEEVIAENKKLAKELNKRNGTENPYGLSTPSSKQVKKKNSTKENQKKRGGGVKGHKGHGRHDFTKEEADRVLKVKGRPPECGCGGGFNTYLGTPYCVIHYIPAKIERRYYEREIVVCSTCGCSENVSVPGILPGYTYSNSAVGNMLAEHYFYGTTAGSLIKRWHIKELFLISHMRSAINCLVFLIKLYWIYVHALLFTQMRHHGKKMVWADTHGFSGMKKSKFLFSVTPAARKCRSQYWERKN